MTRQERETQGLLLAELRLLRAAVELSQQANVGAAFDLGLMSAELERAKAPWWRRWLS